MSVSIKNIVKADDSKCVIKFEDVDEIRINELSNNGPIVGVIHCKNTCRQNKDNTYADIERILRIKVTQTLK